MKTPFVKTLPASLLSSALLAVSVSAFAADATTDTTRDQRMNSALQNYESQHHSNTASGSKMSDQTKSGGRFAHAEDSVKRGAHRTGTAVKKSAHKVGTAVSNAGSKTAAALRNTGDKIHDKIGD